MKNFHRGILVLFGLLVAPFSHADSVMSTAAGFAVTTTGAATYTIPLRLPASVAGFGPRLSLSYSSQGGNGLLGMGWTIAGFSTITRCPATLAHDGVNWPDGTNQGRFCLDGRRLVSGKYFDDAAVYLKDINDLSKIVPGGPSFTLTNPSGQTVTYGGNADALLGRYSTTQSVNGYELLAISRLVAPQGHPLEMNFHYNKDTVNGELYPKSIEFPATVATSSVALQNSIQFVYESRPDVEVSYRSGLRLRTSVRLKEIRAYHADTLANVYKLAYDQEPATDRSRLTSVVECAGDGSCFPATMIAYASASPVSFGSAIQSGVVDKGQETGRAWVDINGDGMADFCRVTGTAGAYKLACTLSTNSGFGDTIASGVIDPGLAVGRAWVDVNGDGLPDYCRLTGTANLQDSRAECVLSTGAGFGAKVGSGILDWGFEPKRAWRDVDGDGRADFCSGVSSNSLSVRCAFSTGGAIGPVVALGDPKPLGPYSGEMASDAQNIFCRAVGTSDPTQLYKSCLFFGNNYSNSTSLKLGWGVASGRAFADINADGYADYCRVIGTEGNYRLDCTPALSAAEYFPWDRDPAVDVVSDILDAGTNVGRTWVDVNMDGRADYCRRIGTANLMNSRIACTLAKSGVGFGVTVTSDVLDWGEDNGSDWVDLRGDGHSAYCRLTATTNGQDSRLTCTPLLVDVGGAVKITSGLNNHISIVYKPLTDSSVYTKDTNAVYPQRDVISASYVVSSVAAQNGAGGVQTTTYQYGGYKADLTSGRGGLGFRWLKTTRNETSLATLTEFGQVWPYVGLPISVKTMLPGRGFNGVLSQLSNTYDCIIPPGGHSCTPEGILTNPTYRYSSFFPYVKSVVESRWDLNGAEFPVVTTDIVLYGTTAKVRNKKVSTSDGFTTETQNIIGDIWGDGLAIKTKTTETRTKQ